MTLGFTEKNIILSQQAGYRYPSQHDQMLCQFLELGVLMLTSGAEVYRVEETLSDMGTAYGAEQMNVFVITSSIVVTMIIRETQANGSSIPVEITQTRRIKTSGSTDFTHLERLNILSRRFCQHPFSADTLKIEIDKIRTSTYPHWLFYAGSVLAAGSFAMFFGGTFLDAIVASAAAILICIMQERLGKLSPNQVTFNLICALITGLFIGLSSILIPDLNPDKVMIGDIMLLIPGIAMTNAVRDILVGDTMAGSLRFMESFLWAGALACGFMTSMILLNGIF